MPVKAACRAAGVPTRFAEVFRAIRSGVYPGRLESGPRGVLVVPSEVLAFLSVPAGSGAGTGAVTGAGTGTVPALAPRPSPTFVATRVDVEALRQDYEFKRVRRALADLEEGEREAERRRAAEAEAARARATAEERHRDEELALRAAEE